MPHTDPPFLDDLSLALDHAWTLLERGARDRRSPFHLTTIATRSENGPEARTVTLRVADRERACLCFNIDRRGGLAAQLARDPQAALHAYGAAERTQLRLRGAARVHVQDDVALRAWEQVTASARRCYLVPPPGSRSAVPSSGLPDALERRAPTSSESAAAYENFCVLDIGIHRIEWLYLHSQHKRRALFEIDQPAWSSHWLTP